MMNRTLKAVLLSSASTVVLYAIAIVYIKMASGLQSFLVNALVGAVIALVSIGIYKLTKKK